MRQALRMAALLTIVAMASMLVVPDGKPPERAPRPDATMMQALPDHLEDGIMTVNRVGPDHYEVTYDRPDGEYTDVYTRDAIYRK